MTLIVTAVMSLLVSSLAVAGAETTDTERREQLKAALAETDARVLDTSKELESIRVERKSLDDRRVELQLEHSTVSQRLDESEATLDRLGAQKGDLVDELATVDEQLAATDNRLATLATNRIGPAAVRDEFAILLYTTGDPRLTSIIDEVVTGEVQLDDAHDRTIFTMVFDAALERLAAVDATIAEAIDRRSSVDEQRSALVLARSDTTSAIAEQQVTHDALSKRVNLLDAEDGRLDRNLTLVEQRVAEAESLLTALKAATQKDSAELDLIEGRIEKARAAELAAKLEREQRERERLEQAQKERNAREAAARAAEDRRSATTAESASASDSTSLTPRESGLGSTGRSVTGSTGGSTATSDASRQPSVDTRATPTSTNGQLATAPSTSTDAPTAAIIGPGGQSQSGSTTSTSTPTGATRGAGRGVLTGLGSGPNRPALAVKVDNSPRARPQTGINQADVVFEELVEGGLTRLVAVFHSNDPSSVGPIRSGRTSDIHILGNLNSPLLAFSGANPGVLRQLAESSVTLASTTEAGSAYSRDSSRPAPHNLYASPARLRGVDGAGVPRELFGYRATGAGPSSSAQSANSVSIAFGAVRVDYAWDGAGWARSTSGTAHTDSAGVRVAPENVVVRFSNYRPSQVDSRSPEVIFAGSGTVWVFTAGKLVKGTWSQRNDASPATYTDQAGQPILLTPGRTWVALAEPGSARLG